MRDNAPFAGTGEGPMKVRTKWVDGVSFVGESGSGHAVVVDGSPDDGGRNLGMRPMELVLLGTAGCTAFDVVLILRKARQPIADCTVEAEAERAATIPRVFTRIHFKYSVAGRGLDPGPRGAGGEAVERQVLLGHADARQDRRDHLRDRDHRRRPRAVAGRKARVLSPPRRRRQVRPAGLGQPASRNTRIRLDESQRPPPFACTRA